MANNSNSAREVMVIEDDQTISSSIVPMSMSAVTGLMKAEIDQQIATAHAYPRSLTKCIDNILTLATLDEETAEDCVYALPRAGKPIRGPSVRLAEIIAQQWGNNRVAARIIDVNRVEKYVESEAVFHDLETNAAVKATVRRRIVDSKGKLFSDDMILVTSAAANSIARRNAILAGTPKAVWNRAYKAAELIIKGNIQTLTERRATAIAAFGQWGVTPAEIFAALGVRGEDEITLEHIPTLKGMYSGIKNGEQTVEELFRPISNALAGTGQPAHNPLKDTPSADATPMGSPSPSPRERPQSDPALGLRPDHRDGSVHPDAVRSADRGEAPNTSPHPLPEQSDTVISPRTTVADSGEASVRPDEASPTSSPAANRSARSSAGEGEAAKPRAASPNSSDRAMHDMADRALNGERIHPDEIARQRGYEAAKAGRSRKAMPAEYKEPDRLSEGNAWIQGYDQYLSETEGQAGRRGRQ